VTSTSWTPSSSLSDGTYYWRVREKDDLNRYSDYTSVRSFVVDTVSPSSVPTCTANACYKTSQSVTCSATEGTIRYTTNGEDPTCSSSAWSNQSFNATTTLKVIACDAA
jgi:hypothetical protein